MFTSLPKHTNELRKLLLVIFGCIFISATVLSQVNLKISLAENQKKGLYKIQTVLSCGSKSNRERAMVQMAFPMGSKILSPVVYPVDLEPGKEQILHFKFYLPPDENSLDSLAIMGEVISMGESSLLARANLLIAPPGQKPLLFENLSPEVIAHSKSFSLSFKISNPSTNSQEVNLKPQDFTGLTFQKISFDLPPGKDTIINIREKVSDAGWFEQTRYINYYLLNKEGKILKSQGTQFIPHLSKKNFSLSNRSPNTLHQMEFGYAGGDLGNYLQTRITNEFNTLTRHRSLSFQANYFPEINALRVFNTLYQVENEKILFGIGNLSRNDEMNIFGRGASFGWKEDEYVFSFGAINQNANLVAPLNQKKGIEGNAIYFEVDQQLRNYWKLKSALVGNFTPEMNRAIWSFSFQKETETDFYQLKTGAGINFNKREMFAPGGFVDFQIQKKAGNWSVYLNNYLASLDHPGRRAGQQIYLNQVKYQLTPTWDISLLSQQRFFPSPSGRFPVSRAYSLNKRQEFQLLFEKEVKPNFHVGISPKYMRQKAGYYVGNRLVEAFTNTNPGLLGQMEWSGENARINLSTEVGKYRTQSERNQLSDQTTWQAGGTFFWKGFSGNIKYQKGSIFFLEELDAGRGIDGRQFLSMGMASSHNLFQQRVAVNWGGQMVYNNTRKNWYKNYWLGITYQVGPQLQVQAKGNVLQSGFSNNFNWELAIKKTISSTGQKGKKGKVIIEMQESGTRKPIKNLVVRLDNQKLISDENGKIQLNKIPYGTYLLQIRDPSGNYPIYSDSVIIRQNRLLLTIPFIPPVEISGKLELNRQKFSDDRVVPSGIKIWMEGENGKKQFTFTGMDGSYHFKVPFGKYKIWIDKSGLPGELEVLNNFGRLEFREGEPLLVYNFELLIRSRKTRIKYFND